MISKVLNTLYKDHINLGQLFMLIEREIERIGTDQSDPYFETLTLALEYCVDYPRHFHHPMEDLIFDKLIRRAPKLMRKTSIIITDHKNLLQLTESLSNAVASAIESGATKPVHTLGLEFLRQYRRHMHIEDTELFPAAEMYLTQGDWSEIEIMAKIPIDPLFTKHVRDAYLALKHRITTHAQKNQKVQA